MPFPLQDTKGHQTTRDVMHLRALGARLTAGQHQLILADSNHLLDLRAEAIRRRTSAAVNVRRLVA